MNQESNTDTSAAEQTKGLIATLFDFSFTSFVTTKFIKFIYGLAMLVALGGVLSFIIGGFGHGIFTGLLCMIVSPIVGFIFLFFARIWTEMIVVAFRVAEHLRSIDAKTPPRS